MRKDSGDDGWADVWKRGCFAWEYKGKHADLDAAFNQLRQYALALDNPPLLIVSDMARFDIHIRTNWANSVSVTHEFALDNLAEGATFHLYRVEIETVLDWSETARSILGALFEHSLGPDKRSQLGAHYTDRDKIMAIVEPVVVRPLLAHHQRHAAGGLGSGGDADGGSAGCCGTTAQGACRPGSATCRLRLARPCWSGRWTCSRSSRWRRGPSRPTIFCIRCWRSSAPTGEGHQRDPVRRWRRS